MGGKFITFEGIEGCGKTTQVELICRELDSRGVDYIRTREPGGTQIGEQVRSILLNPKNQELAPTAELLLYLADRAQHIAEKILPALGQGMIVLCDRYMDATLAYQGYGRGLDRVEILELNRLATDGLKPDATFLIDLPVETGLSRATRRNDETGKAHTEGRFEEEDLTFHNRVREGYLALADMEPERFKIVDGSQNPEETCRQILSLIDSLL